VDARDSRVHDRAVRIESLSAVTLGTHDMSASVRFYTGLGFAIRYGGPDATFTSYHAGPSYLNVVLADPSTVWSWWGRVILHVDDVDAVYQRSLGLGYLPLGKPRDAEWGERYFHITDPDGHELSFARLL
jgi:catechol 2,3-dioxygenase-like lactoylglutathione lyase family enzyme